MFCPHCGASDQSDRAYCKHCGKWLGSAPPEKRMIVMLVFNLLSAIFGAASAIALYGTYLGTRAGTPAVYLAAAFCTVISVYQTIGFCFTLGLLRRLRFGRAGGQRGSELLAGRKAGALEDGKTTEFVSRPSVTESTTELLAPVARTARTVPPE